MTRLIIPAISALLFAGFPAQAHNSQSLHIARNFDGGAPDMSTASPHDNDQGGDDSKERKGRGHKDRSGDEGTQGDAGRGAMTGDATVGGHVNATTAPDDKGRGDKNRSDKSGPWGGTAGGASASGAATAGPAAMDARGHGERGGRGGETGGAQSGTGVSGGAAIGGATMGGTVRGGAGMGERGTTFTGRGQVGANVFGTRPPNWNRYPRRFDTNIYQRNYSASRQFHWRSYHRPSHWYYQRWVFGQIFPRIFWSPEYWIIDYWMFDLPIPPYGYVWVRYDDDALLINRRTGRVLQVVYGVFY